ncbi:MAG TPA: alpha/beta hydrolase, partial [Phycisphaerales bacterium]|nr:alpha/beta hydrolase [Phycisphaerales bacterium]
TAPGKDGHGIELKMDCAFLKKSDGQPMPVIIYIHGGGWSGGNRNMGLPFSIAFARGGYFACTISYRLSGEAIFPAQVHDVKAAVRFIREHAEQLVIDPDRIGVWGHSAGGHLSAMLGVTGNDHSLDGPVNDKSAGSEVQAVVDVSGPTDLVRIAPGGNGGPMISQFLGGTVREKQDEAKAASPVNYVDAKDAPFLIIQGGQDNLVPDEQAEIMRDALKKAGVECEYLYIAESGHGVPDRRAFQATAEFFDKHLGGKSVEAFAELGRRFPGVAGGGEGGAGDGAGAGRPRRPNARPQSQPATQPQ